jgi:tetratricopeptide (TPR) repeat protein
MSFEIQKEVSQELSQLFLQKHFDIVELKCRSIIQFQKDNEFVINLLACSLMEQKKFEDSIFFFKKSLSINSKNPETYLNLARIYFIKKEIEQSLQHYSKVLELRDDLYYVYYELGNVYVVKNDDINAVKNFAKAVSLKNDFADGYFNLGVFLKKLNKTSESIYSFNKAIQYNPKDFEAYNYLGMIHSDLEKNSEAIEFYKKAIFINPNLVVGYTNIAQIYLADGQFKECESYIRKGLEIKKNDSESHRLLSVITKYDSVNSHILEMESYLEDKNLSDDDKMRFQFALAKAYEDVNNFTSSAKMLINANQLRRKSFKYNISHDLEQFDKIKYTFSSNFFKKFDLQYQNSVKPIFVVGMPRSGTSLVEQIISSHHDVYGAGEISSLSDCINKVFNHVDLDIFFNKVNKSSGDNFKNIGEDYLKQISKLSSKKVIVDKMVLNFRLIGFIKICIPEAKIIHCVRSSRDTCISIYKNFFGKNVMPWAYDQIELAKYCNGYKDLILHWKNVIPESINDIVYEDLVTNPEEEVRKLIKFCGLEWDSNCLNFFQNKRSVNTASVNQVRKNFYKSSVEIWKNYESLLVDLFKNLKD